MALYLHAKSGFALLATTLNIAVLLYFTQKKNPVSLMHGVVFMTLGAEF